MITIERATLRDFRWPALFLALGVVGAVIAARFFFQAFPEASIDLRLPREEITRRSEQILRARGFSIEGYRRVTVFDFDDQAKTYLERELGLEEANRAMADQVNVWRWRTRWIRPPEKQEFSVSLTPAGQLVGLDRQVAEDAPGARLEKGEAQRIAEVFLRAERGVRLDDYQLVTDDLKERPRRLDYTFTWEHRTLRLEDARQRLSVTVLGDQVGTFREFLKIPEQWTRDYERLRSQNNVLQVIATGLYAVLFVIALVLTFRVAGRDPSQPALVAIAVVCGVLMMANLWNDFGLQTLNMRTNTTLGAWTAIFTVLTLLAGIGTTLYILLLAAAGEPLYRRALPEKVALSHLFTLRGLRSKEFFTSTLIGYGMAALHIGLLVAFYVVARQLGAWAPLDVKYNNAISTALPWLQPLSISVFASVSEEFAFRLLAIPLLLRWTRSPWVAILLPAFLWGFLHSGYPQQPAWIRGVEVGLIGVLAGWVFLRFGILATLVWHYTVDAVLIGMFLLRSEELGFRMAGAVVGDMVLLPLVIGAVFYLQNRGFLRDDRILNRAVTEEAERAVETLPVAPEVAAPLPGEAAPGAGRFAFAPRGPLRRLALAGVIGVIAAVAIDAPRLGEGLRVQIGRGQAEALATDHLRVQRVPVERYRRATWLEDGISGSAADYLAERAGYDSAARIYRDRVPSVFWRTRFYRPPHKEEYDVWVTLDGRLHRVDHQVEEKAPGARLEKPEALALAERFLAARTERLGMRPGDYRLIEHHLERREARSDHTLVWEGRTPLAGEATHRVRVVLRGEEPSGPRHWVKVPEEWERRHTRPTLFTVVPIVLIVGLGIAALWAYVRALQRVPVRWGRHVALGAVAAAIHYVVVVNTTPASLQQLPTAIPPEAGLTVLLIGGLIGALFIGAVVTLLASMVQVLVADRFGAVAWAPATPAGRGRMALEALAGGIAGAGLLAGVEAVAGFLQARIPSGVRDAASGLPSFQAHLAPSLDVVLGTVEAALLLTFLVLALGALLLWLFRRRALLVAVLVVGSALGSAAAIDPVHFAETWLETLMRIAALVAVASVLRWNVAGYLVMFLAILSAQRIAALVGHPGIAAAGWVSLAVVVVLLGAVAAFGWSRMRRDAAGESAGWAA